MKADEAKRLKELELENRRLKQVVADLTPDKAKLKEALEERELSESSRRINAGCSISWRAAQFA